jgi:DNA-3-methyladenine glycosylase I
VQAPKSGVIAGADGVGRCWWCAGDPLYESYHDTEWGRPVADDTRLFEKLSLEGFQSGLSWLTILRKRENFRRAFKSFDINSVARFNNRSVERLMLDAGIVRNRAKIEATINNAKRCFALIDEFGSLAAYVWSFEPDERPRSWTANRASLVNAGTNAESTAMSKDLKRRGWSFVGPTTVYSFMEAMGLVNDHLNACDFRDEIEDARATFRRPSS